MLPTEVASHHDDELDLRAYLSVIGRRWKFIVATVLLAVLAALAFTLQQETLYKAESELLIRQSDSATITGDQQINANDAARQLNNEVKLFESGTVRDAVEEVYDGPLDPDTVQASVTSDSSDALTAHVTAADPDEAASLVNLYVDTFIGVRRALRTEELLAVGQEIRTKLDELDARIASTDEENQAALTPLQSQRSFYVSQLDDLELSADITQQSGVQVLTFAEAPDAPVSPKPVRDVSLALVLGLVLGVGLAFLVDSLDERIRTVADLDRISGGLPTMALIPFNERGTGHDYVAARDDPGSAQAEAFRSLRTAVKFASVDRPLRAIQITSANQGEGKTTVVSNLAMALAHGGERTAVICCDLRRPTVQERFVVSVSPGLTDVLAGEFALDSAVRRYTPNLVILPAGTAPRNPSELLSANRTTSVVKALVDQTDIVVLDAPPVLPVTDALVVSRMADATLVVVDARSTTRKALLRTLQLLDQVNAPVIGLVLNGVAEAAQYSYGYGRSYDRQEAAAADDRKAKKARDKATRRGVRV
ncbi:MAG: polysaccharide biosynthesis tyrosine autokinase [Actinomycetota bacterium]|nr:polysaccharide biosynthesis tyrosine autokinase [Actinomycetota bacterium]